MNENIDAVTRRIIERSRERRARYLGTIDAALNAPQSRDRMGCANLAHAWAGLPADDRMRIRVERPPNIAVVSAYNEMLSAHQPYHRYPALIRDEAHRHGALTQMAGGVPAMCDGVTQGTEGMELSLFSRDVIAMSTAIALSHQMFDAALLLGICDKIVPGLLIGALHFGHLPCVFVPAGPMPSGLSNKEKSAVRKAAARGEATREQLLDAEVAAYHAPGTCTFYGTANSNQMLLEAMGLHVPGAAFVAPGTPERDELTRAAVRTVLEISAPADARRAASKRFAPIGRVVDERCIVNAIVALLATGGSTNHLIHWVAVARAAGILVDWSDFDELARVVPLLTRIYPNGEADVNAFQAAGGPALVIRELLDAGLMHPDVLTIHDGGLFAATRPATLSSTEPAPSVSTDRSVIRSVADPFAATGGLRLLSGNLGRSIIKTSSIPDSAFVIEAPARIFDSQQALLAAFDAGELNGDLVAVVRFQGPRANGMPELHKLTPPLAVLQDRGQRVALVTDGRMSGASGVVPAAIHVTPEALDGGMLARLRDGDVLRLDAHTGELLARVAPEVLAERECAPAPDPDLAGRGVGRELFSGFRRRASGAEQGACTW